MKKLLLMTAILSLVLSGQAYAADTDNSVTTTKPQCTSCDKMHKPPMHKNKAEFEKRLKLTDEQKAKAKEIHKKGFDEIKPIMDKLQLKREEIAAVGRSQLSPEAQAEKITQLKKECRELKHQAREIQMKNMREFESILSEKQQKELKKIKEEGRKKFEKRHKHSALKMPPKDAFLPPKPPME